MTDNRTLRQFLQHLASAGVSHLPTVQLQPTARPQLKSRPERAQKARSAEPRTRKAVDDTTVPAALAETTALLGQDFATPNDKASALSQLAQIVAGCNRCSQLADSRRQTVFGVGDPNARIMFIGEAPGADEDHQGEPFVGAAGQLLTKIIEACGFKRQDIYICNILRCRPPGNRNPLPQEAVNCREFLDGQIKIVNPDYIVCWGAVAAHNLLGETRSVGKLRGTFMSHGDAKVLCTYHPSYLLRNESAKKLVWADMKLFMAEMEKDAESTPESSE